MTTHAFTRHKTAPNSRSEASWLHCPVAATNVVELHRLPSTQGNVLKMPKVGFVSLGCPKNLVDSEVMMGILARGGI